MNWLEFIASLIDSVVWPAAIVILVLVLRTPIRNLIPLLQRLKYKDLELEFGRRLEEAREEAAAALSAADQTPALPLEVDQQLIELSRISPRSAVTEAWRRLERAALSAARRNGVTFSSSRITQPLQLVQLLESSGLVDSGKVGLLNELRILRNQAVHAPEFALSPDSALEYSQVAGQLTDYLNGINPEAG